MINVDQIREELKAVIDGRQHLDAFDEWLTAHSWNMHRDSESDAIAMVGKIELLLADFDGGRISNDKLIQELQGVASIFKMSGEVHTAGLGDNLITQYEWSAASDKQPSMGFSYTPLLQH